MAQKFLLIIYGSGDDTAALPEDKRQEYMNKWFAWDKDLRQKGIIQDGEALTPQAKYIQGSERKINSGYYSDDPTYVIGGYYTIKADNLDEAIIIAKGCPVFDQDGVIEVREVMDMDQ